MSEGGTLCQLKPLINRTNIPEKPKQNVHAAEEFLAAALHHFKMNKIRDSPSSTFLDELDAENDSTSQKELLNSAVPEMVSSYIIYPNLMIKITRTMIRLELMHVRYYNWVLCYWNLMTVYTKEMEKEY